MCTGPHRTAVLPHVEAVTEMLAILCKNDLFLNIDKCQFEQTEVNYLGVHVGGQQVQMEEAKVT